MSISINTAVHISNFSGDWRKDVLSHGTIKLDRNDIEEFEEGKFKLKDTKANEVGIVFSRLRTINIPDTLSPFKGEELKTAIRRGKQIIYRTFLRAIKHFNTSFPNHFNLDDDKTLVPTFTDFQHRPGGIGIHTEGGLCIKKLQALTYMPSIVNGELTLYKLFDPDRGQYNNKNLQAISRDLESVTLSNLDSSNLPAIFMVDGENGTAHSATIPYNKPETFERIIWTIIVNKIKSLKLKELIPDFKDWLEKDVLTFAEGNKREENKVTRELMSHTLISID